MYDKNPPLIHRRRVFFALKNDSAKFARQNSNPLPTNHLLPTSADFSKGPACLIYEFIPIVQIPINYEISRK